MMRNRSMLIALALSSVLVIAGLLGGCASSSPSSAPSSSSSGAAEQTSPAPLSLMSADEKYARIAQTFPPQVPVPAGTIESGRAQGDSAWDYTIVVAGGAASVREWYRMAYVRADWSVVGETSDSLSFQKSAAQSMATFGPADSGATTRVVVTVGVGTPVLDLQ